MSTPLQVAFMTGQSDPLSCALSPAQNAFLHALAVPDAAKVRRNFPYVDSARPYRNVSLAAASWHNARQYLASRSTAFARRHRPAVVEMIDQSERTVLLAGSCGLEILTNLGLPDTSLRRISVFAYGAVARRRPACEILAVRGRRDWIASFRSGHDDLVVECDHMTYLENDDVLTLCRTFLTQIAGKIVQP